MIYRRGTSFKRGNHLRRTLSKEQDQETIDTGATAVAGATPNTDLETQVGFSYTAIRGLDCPF